MREPARQPRDRRVAAADPLRDGGLRHAAPREQLAGVRDLRGREPPLRRLRPSRRFEAEVPDADQRARPIAAMDAARWWRFRPYRARGEPATVETTLSVEFHP